MREALWALDPLMKTQWQADGKTSLAVLQLVGQDIG
jgi:hypothetical protein